MLEWFYPDRTGRVVTGLFLSLVAIVAYTLMDWGFSWVENPWLWLLVVPWPFILLATGGNYRTAAGADWLIYGKNGFVKTYELKSVKVHIEGPVHAIDLEDRNGRGLRVKLHALQENRQLWDLVYNGILHSVHVGGAETNKRARDYLLLDFPPHLRA
ncbi:hypothetical protein [Prauserella flavalba]|nr:hypothetical protein [Prauserella flavalba]